MRALLGGDGSLEFTPEQTNSIQVIGLSHGNTNTDFSDVDFGIELYVGGRVYVIEGGTMRGAFGAYAAGDRFAVGVENGVVVYRRNGLVLYTSSVAPTYPLLVDTALFSLAATVTDVVLSGRRLVEAVTWTALVGVTPSGNSLQKTAPDEWNAGAASSRSLASGDGFLCVARRDERRDGGSTGGQRSLL